MADLLMDAQGTPAAPAAGKMIVYPDSSSKQFTGRNENSRCFSFDGVVRNWNTAAVVANGADTYLTGSGLAIPQHGLQIGATFKWRFAMTKTGAGVAAPTWSVRSGTLGTVADSQKILFTSPAAQTAVNDAGIVDITAILYSLGVGGVIAGALSLIHNLAATGLSVQQIVALQVNGNIDTTIPNLIVGVSCNPGAAGVWTHQLVAAEVANM
jgi:hypothetical protein